MVSELHDTMLPKLWVRPSTYRVLYQTAQKNRMTMRALITMLLEQWAYRQTNTDQPPHRSPGHRLTNADKQRIRIAGSDGWTTAQVCKHFNITPPTARKYMSETP